jgi:hypothetical protein
LFFRTVPTANTLVRWVNENAFAPIVRARPCPTFGRPVHRRGSPHRLRPGTSPHTLRIPPHGGHPVLRSNTESGFRFTLAVSSFRFRARLGFSIPSLFSGQRGITPAFGYSAPHPGAGGTLTLLNSALLSAHYATVRLLQRVHVRRAACGLRGPALIITPRRAGDLPVLVHVVSQRARVLRLRRTGSPLAINAASHGERGAARMERVPAIRNCPAIARDEGDQSYFWALLWENYAALKIAFSHGHPQSTGV